MSAPAAGGGSKGEKEGKGGDKEGKGIKDETIAKAAGVVIGAGIAWSLIRSFWPRKSNETTLVVETENRQADNKIEEFVETVESKIKDVEHRGKDIFGNAKEAGSHFFEKKSDVIDVHKGDTLWGISRKYGVSVEALKAANGIRAGDSLSAGDTLVIPK